MAIKRDMLKAAISLFVLLITTLACEAASFSIDILKQYRGPYGLNPYHLNDRELGYQGQKVLNDRKYSIFYAMMPREFYNYTQIQTPWATDLVDQVHLEIFSKSKTARALCGLLTGGSEWEMERVFGVSIPTQEKIKALCPRPKGWNKQTGFGGFKEFIFALVKEKPLVDSWTNDQGVTLIMVYPPEITHEKLLRVFIHELAVELDEKDSFAIDGKFIFQKKELNYQGDKKCHVGAAIRNPLIKTAAVALRAEKIEDQILQEMGYSIQKSDTELSCAVKLLSRVSDIAKVPVDYDEFTWGSQPYYFCEEEYNMAEQINLLESEQIEGKSVCQFLTEPSLGQHAEWTQTKGGPRPRIGGGWSAMEAEKVLTNPKDQSNVLKIQDFKPVTPMEAYLRRNKSMFTPQQQEQIMQMERKK